MTKSTLLFVILSLYGVTLAAKRINKTCKGHNDPSFSPCLEEAANIYFAALDKEVDSVHKTWKPVNTSINNGPLQVQLDYNLTKFINSTKSLKVELKYDGGSKTLSGTLTSPSVGYEVHANVNGRFGTAKLIGEGVSVCQVWDMKASFETHLQIKSGSKTKFEMDKFKFKIDSVRSADIDIIELTTKTKSLENTFRHVVRNFPDQIYFLGKEKWEYNLEVHYEDLFREFLNEIVDEGLVKNV